MIGCRPESLTGMAEIQGRPPFDDAYDYYFVDSGERGGGCSERTGSGRFGRPIFARAVRPRGYVGIRTYRGRGRWPERIRKQLDAGQGNLKPTPCPPSDAASKTCAGPTSSNGGLVARQAPNQRKWTAPPGAVISFAETHVMEHRLYVLEDKAVYLLNRDWVEVEAGDYMWLRAFCPQACYASCPGRFRYLLYKDVNRHMSLQPAGTLAQRTKP